MPILKPKDIIAVLILVGAFFLLINGVDSPITEMVALIVGYYFGHRKSGVDDG